MITLNHTHTAECLGANELDELCCADVTDLKAHRRHTVTVWRVGGRRAVVHTFTDTPEDAMALVRAMRPEWTHRPMRVTFVDTDNKLDPYN